MAVGAGFSSTRKLQLEVPSVCGGEGVGGMTKKQTSWDKEPVMGHQSHKRSQVQITVPNKKALHLSPLPLLHHSHPCLTADLVA